MFLKTSLLVAKKQKQNLQTLTYIVYSINLCTHTHVYITGMNATSHQTCLWHRCHNNDYLIAKSKVSWKSLKWSGMVYISWQKLQCQRSQKNQLRWPKRVKSIKRHQRIWAKAKRRLMISHLILRSRLLNLRRRVSSSVCLSIIIIIITVVPPPHPLLPLWLLCFLLLMLF